MCGIAGIVNKNGFQPSVLAAMSDVIRHRGPDDEGFLTVDSDKKIELFHGKDSIPEVKNHPHIASANPNKTYCVGMLHRRLSIIDLSAHGHQPMPFANGKYYISFNGEIYNYKELKEELQRKGHSFTTDSDTEVILAAYHEWGLSCPQKFVGMWAFAIYDVEAEILFISRDRFGIKPLYLYMQDDELIFASEIKAILQHPSVHKAINRENLYQYLSFGKVEDVYSTLFENIIELPVAYNLIYHLREDRIVLKGYYHLEDAVSGKIIKSSNDPYRKYKKMFEDSIDIHLRSDVPVGSCLSGGLDSSAIVAFANQKLQHTTFNTFTAVYDDQKIDESYFAKKVSSSFPNIQAYYTQPTAEKYWKDIDQLIWHQDLPIASTSMFAQWEVMKLARDHGMKVLLDGQGADETLGGYSVFTGVYLFSLIKKLKWITFLKESRSLKANRSVRISNEVGRAAFYYLPDFMKKSVRAKKRIGSGFIADDFKKEFADLRDKGRMGGDYLEMSLLSIKHGMHELLRYEDRNSMAFSIESRVPFLDHRLVEYSLALPDRNKIRDGWSKYVLRKAINKSLPDEVVWRKDKKGFITPQQDWKNKLKPQLREFVNDVKMPSMINKKFINDCIENELTNATQLSEFWKMISFLKWLDVYKISV